MTIFAHNKAVFDVSANKTLNMMAGCEHYEAIVCKYGYRSFCKQNLYSEAVYAFGRKKERKKREISSDFSFKKSLLDAFLLKVNSQEKSAKETKKNYKGTYSSSLGS